MEDLASMLIRHEGLKLKMYKDSLGIATIGVGHNLQDSPITKEAAMLILHDDIMIATASLTQNVPWISKLDAARQNVLIDMCFNMGITHLLTFKNTLRAIEDGKYDIAAQNMLESKWATQVGKRAAELASIMKTGV